MKDEKEFRFRRGYTLLEVMLAMLLASLVLVALGMAVDTQLRVVEKGRSHVEEAQLARALLQRIANDIRGTVRYDPLDIASLVPGMSEESLQALTDKSGFEGMDMSEVERREAEEDGTPPSESVAPPLIPGLYGNRYELRVDVSRLPRIDQFQRALAPSASGLADRLSDVKTVAYFVIPPDDRSGVFDAGETASPSGLFRRELDRAVTCWAADEGTLDEMDLELAPIAPEVLAIEFLYFDGQEWLEEWDSDEMGGLPSAVQIGIAIEPASQRGLASRPGSLPRGVSDEADERPMFYRLLVHLPAAAPMTGDGTGGLGDASTSDSEENEAGEDDASKEESGGRKRSGRRPGGKPSPDGKFPDRLPGKIPDKLPGKLPDGLPGNLPIDPRTITPKMLRDRGIDPGRLRERFSPEMMRGRSFNPEMFRNLMRGGGLGGGRGIPGGKGGGFPGRSFGGGGRP